MTWQSSREFQLWFAVAAREAYLTPEVSLKVDQVMKEYRAGRLLARPIAAGEIELEMSVSITSSWSNCRSYRIL